MRIRRQIRPEVGRGLWRRVHLAAASTTQGVPLKLMIQSLITCTRWPVVRTGKKQRRVLMASYSMCLASTGFSGDAASYTAAAGSAARACARARQTRLMRWSPRDPPIAHIAPATKSIQPARNRAFPVIAKHHCRRWQIAPLERPRRRRPRRADFCGNRICARKRV